MTRAFGTRKPGESNEAYMRRTYDRAYTNKRTEPQRKARAQGFWTQIVLDYIIKNPGCNGTDLVNCLVPHRSPALTRKIVRSLVKSGKITVDRSGRTHKYHINNDQSSDPA